jgi:hypothetical protein
MSEELTGPAEPDPDEAETSALAVADAAGNKMVPLSALMAVKRENKTLKGRVGELEPVAARVTETNDRLDAASPYINAIANNPKLKAEALRANGHTRASGEDTAQPDDDPDAEEWAEIHNLYLPDGVTLDVARAKRSMAVYDRRNGRTVTEAIRPLAGVTLNQRAESNLREVLNMEDANGTPLVTRDSLQEVAAQLPQHLLADDNVKTLVLRLARGIDAEKGRTPKAQDEPLFMESSRRSGPREVVIDSDTKARLSRLGLSEKDYLESSKRLEHGVANRTGISLGGK